MVESVSLYANQTFSNATWPAAGAGRAIGRAGGWTTTGSSSSPKIRSEDAMAACSTLNFSDMSLIGRKKRWTYRRNATSAPSVSVPSMTRRPPYQMMRAQASALTASTAG
jgi:hypothetical protein